MLRKLRLLFLLFSLVFGPFYGQRQPENLLSEIAVAFLREKATAISYYVSSGCFPHVLQRF